MVRVETYRDFFDEVALLCESLEALNDLADLADSQSRIVVAGRPAITRLRELLDAADAFAGPERVE